MSGPGSVTLDGATLGAVPGSDGTTVRVWAPDAARVAVRVEDAGRDVPLDAEGDGYHRGRLSALGDGARYRIVLDGGPMLADPASRHQPDGVDGPSAVFDPGRHRWRHAAFEAPPLADWVLYELHVGAFGADGTLDGAAAGLGRLATLGVTTVELMPVAQFPGRRGWGYDGVFPWAVHDAYGGPAALQRFVDAAHGAGLAVVLDVVYNHLGPTGCVLRRFGPYFTGRYRTPWGDAVNYDGPGSDEVRRYFVESALWWLRDFHVDGLRLDAVSAIVDATARPFLLELTDAVAALAARLGRRLVVIAESDANDPAVLAPGSGNGLGMDGQWVDDFHHALWARVTGERQGYYADFGTAGQLGRALAGGFVFEGEHSAYRGRRHGAPLGATDPRRLVVYAQNHDQIGNRPRGERATALLSSPAVRLLMAAVLLSPFVPLLFMGEEYGETAPFPFFCDDADPTLADAVRRGRADELAGFGWHDEMLDPLAGSTFDAARLRRAEPATGPQRDAEAFVTGLLALRRSLPVLASPADARFSGDVHVSRRGHPVEAVVVLNVGPVPATARLGPAVGPGCWARRCDGADPALGGSGPRPEPELAGDAALSLPGWGFCVYAWRAVP